MDSRFRLKMNMSKLVSFLIYVYVCCLLAIVQAVPERNEKEGEGRSPNYVACEIELMEHIFNESSVPAHVRPVDNPSRATTIHVSFELKTVMDIEEQLQILKTHNGITLNWTDEFRTWDPSAYCDLEEIGVESKDLWLPDMTLLNSADEGNIMSNRPMVARSNGEVIWDGLVIFESFCKIDFQFFPYDEQKCVLILRAWSYPKNKVVLRPGDMLTSADEGKIMSNRPMVAKWDGEVIWDGIVVCTSFCKIDFSFFPYDEQKCELILRAWSYPKNKVVLRPGDMLTKDETMDNGEWDVVRISSVPKQTLREGKNYSDLFITIHMERRPQFYFMNIIIPCVIIYCLTLFGFCLPADSGEKIGLGITILLSLTVFMLISADMMPPTSDNFPLIAQFYTSTMVLVASSIGMSVIVLNFNHRGPKAAKAPRWMSSLLLGTLSKILFVSGSKWGKEAKGQKDDRPTSGRKEGPACIEECMDDLCVTTNEAYNTELMLVPYDPNPQFSPSPLTQTDPTDGSEKSQKVVGAQSPSSDMSCNGGVHKDFIERQLRSISSNLQHLVDHHREQDEEADVLDEWKLLATAVDRLCLIIFLTGSLILMFTLATELMRRSGESEGMSEFSGEDKITEIRGVRN